MHPNFFEDKHTIDCQGRRNTSPTCLDEGITPNPERTLEVVRPSACHLVTEDAANKSMARHFDNRE